MIGDRPLFGPAELPPSGSSAEQATSLAIGRELEALASSPFAPPGPDFTEQVMAAVAAEPVPQPAVAARRAIATGSAGGFLMAVRDAWRVAFSGGRPPPVRAQAVALVLVTAVAIGSVVTGGVVGVGSALGLFESRDPSPVLPSPSVSPSPDPAVSSSPSASPSPSPAPSSTLPPATSAEPTSDPAAPVRSATPRPTAEGDDDDDSDDDRSGSGGGGNSGSGGGGADDDDADDDLDDDPDDDDDDDDS